jgi:pilus assembly protein CpaE
MVVDEAVVAALQSAATIFVVTTQEFPALRNAQRYLGFLSRMGFTQDQVKVVVNRYRKKTGPEIASPEQVTQTLNQPIFYGIPPSSAILEAINKGRPFVADRQAAGELDKIFRSFVTKATGGKTAQEGLAQSA